MTDAVELPPTERKLIRREFMRRLTSTCSIHEDIMLKCWSTGSRKGEPKLPAAYSILARARSGGLVERAGLDRHLPVARVIAAGGAVLRAE